MPFSNGNENCEGRKYFPFKSIFTKDIARKYFHTRIFLRKLEIFSQRRCSKNIPRKTFYTICPDFVKSHKFLNLKHSTFCKPMKTIETLLVFNCFVAFPLKKAKNFTGTNENQ